VLEVADHGQPGAREQAAAEVRGLTRHLVDPVRRETVVREIAQACGLDPNLVRRAGGGVDVVAPPDARRRAGAPRVNALVRCQVVAVAGLAGAPARRGTVGALHAEGAIDHPLACALYALAVELAPAEADAPDAASWLEAAAGRDPELHRALERALMPPPDLILPDWEEAVLHVRRHAQAERARAERRVALSRPDIASNGEALRGLQASLARRVAPPVPGEAVP
jgi:hypothetical protein